jgi:hypothetical protein
MRNSKYNRCNCRLTIASPKGRGGGGGQKQAISGNNRKGCCGGGRGVPWKRRLGQCPFWWCLSACLPAPPLAGCRSLCVDQRAGVLGQRRVNGRRFQPPTKDQELHRSKPRISSFPSAMNLELQSAIAKPSPHSNQVKASLHSCAFNDALMRQDTMSCYLEHIRRQLKVNLKLLLRTSSNHSSNPNMIHISFLSILPQGSPHVI